jgi:hypothetical protein
MGSPRSKRQWVGLSTFVEFSKLRIYCDNGFVQPPADQPFDFDWVSGEKATEVAARRRTAFEAVIYGPVYVSW